MENENIKIFHTNENKKFDYQFLIKVSDCIDA